MAQRMNAVDEFGGRFLTPPSSRHGADVASGFESLKSFAIA